MAGSSAPASAPAKRKHSTLDAPVSPPPSRRKLQSSTTKSAVSSFFTPASQKLPEKINWQERSPDESSPTTLLVAKYIPDNSSSGFGAHDNKNKKVAAFDFDSTLIKTSSGKKFASNSEDWKWWDPSVPGRLRKLHNEEGYRVVIFSNQGGIALKADPKVSKSNQSKVAVFKAKVSAVLNQLDLPVTLYAATEKDIYRKPRTGMWTELLDDYDIHPDDLDLEHSLFVGDAAGRHAEAGRAKDFSCSDRDFAGNIGLKFQTPEEFFLGESPRPFARTFEPSEFVARSAAEVFAPFLKKNKQDIVMFCGSPGAGKSTFYWKNLEPIGYERVNQDILKTREKCLKVADEFLKEGKSVAVDNTNADVAVRKRWVDLAAKHSVPIRCVHFTATTMLSEHNAAVRAFNKSVSDPPLLTNAMHSIPTKSCCMQSLVTYGRWHVSMAFKGFISRYHAPQLSEGFQDITEVAFQFQGTDAEKEVWLRHWT
ncbi:hypothetical protein HYFRA_00001005 [Hymenoscyphus fraxineus]|uniref:DNA kinase/phosphatase Pnk1 n=1 Tax=Hymenoscyphus fraxineus TaxID=746836 RepID=A0A9N9PQM9_9HELO|nr:hypothetical protein HYFRA_00001005 [Hymenoscyphus fraxineus]